ncbi:hypothetical protein J3458_004481 [Metarhizium acridum]|uniref:uncharacterized protein n=1 Tax=Metarhizium acridum TaxID=92637 RepID=UPI001C6BF8D2|nr:hypothetical protein J3458_004481 [Metarhizium acridum]
MGNSLGEDKMKLLVAEAQGHLYELTKFIEDDAPGMDTVREAVWCLDEIVASNYEQSFFTVMQTQTIYTLLQLPQLLFTRPNMVSSSKTVTTPSHEVK